MDTTTAIPSTLDETTLTQLRNEAAYLASTPFVDPRMLHQIESAAGWSHPEWVARITGQEHLTPRRADYKTGILVALASQRDHEHLWWLSYQRITAATEQAGMQREATRRRRFQDAYAWERLREAIPVLVRVAHNWYWKAHVTGNNWSSDHIVVLDDLHAGRLHRSAGMALCQTRQDDPRFDHLHQQPGDETRVPTCKQCLRIAERWKP